MFCGPETVGCPKVACSRDSARDVLLSTALSPLRANASETVEFSRSHVIRSPPMKHLERRTLAIGM